MASRRRGVSAASRRRAGLRLPTDVAVADGPLRDEIVIQHDDVRFIAFLQAASFAKLEALDLVPAGRLDGLAERQSRDADKTA